MFGRHTSSGTQRCLPTLLRHLHYLRQPWHLRQMTTTVVRVQRSAPGAERRHRGLADLTRRSTVAEDTRPDTDQPIELVAELTTGKLAQGYLVLAEAAEGDEATTYTDEVLYRATKRLAAALLEKLAQADVIMGSKPRRLTL